MQTLQEPSTSREHVPAGDRTGGNAAVGTPPTRGNGTSASAGGKDPRPERLWRGESRTCEGRAVGDDAADSRPSSKARCCSFSIGIRDGAERPLKRWRQLQSAGRREVPQDNIQEGSIPCRRETGGWRTRSVCGVDPGVARFGSAKAPVKAGPERERHEGRRTRQRGSRGRPGTSLKDPKPHERHPERYRGGSERSKPSRS